MLFTPHVKPKRFFDGKLPFQPFPKGTQGLYEGTFTGLSVEVSNYLAILDLYTNGCYGKGSQSRGAPGILLSPSIRNKTSEADETLSLGLEEAFFLSFYLNVLRIRDVFGVPLDWQDFLREAIAINDKFLESLATYVYFKSKGWVVKSGMKFGGEFLIYRKGPRYFHASFVVAIVSSSESGHLNASSLKCFQRIAETSHKDVIIIEVSKPPNYRLDELEGLNQLEISESVVTRFNYTSFVQQQKNALK